MGEGGVFSELRVLVEGGITDVKRCVVLLSKSQLITYLVYSVRALTKRRLLNVLMLTFSVCSYYLASCRVDGNGLSFQHRSNRVRLAEAFIDLYKCYR